MFRRTVDRLSECVFRTAESKKVVVPLITDPILKQSAFELAEVVKSRRLTCEEVVEAFIARAERVNPILNFIAVKDYDRARAVAKEIDSSPAMWADPKKPLLGVPFSVKETFAVAGLKRTLGLVRRKDDEPQEEDARVVRLLLDAGAILLFTTNVSELAMWWDCRNRVYGDTLNPHDTRRSVGGSSGGEACAVATGCVAFGIGSDVGGSIRIPCHFNGVFGLKPSPGKVPNEGMEPNFGAGLNDMLCTGPICRYAKDLAPLYDILTSTTETNTAATMMESIKFHCMESDGSGGGLVSEVDAETKLTLETVANLLDFGAHADVDWVTLPKLAESYRMWSAKMTAGATTTYAHHLGGISPVRELVKWIFRMSDLTLPSICLALFETVQSVEEKYLDMCDELAEEFDRMLGQDGVFLYPSHPTPAPYIGQPVLNPFNFAYTAIFNALGLPVVQCPVDMSSKGLPIGIQVVARRGNDRLAMDVAVELEARFGGWVEPQSRKDALAYK